MRHDASVSGKTESSTPCVRLSGTPHSPRGARQLSVRVREARGRTRGATPPPLSTLLTELECGFAVTLTSGASDAEFAQLFFVAEKRVKSTLAAVRAMGEVRMRAEVAIIVARSAL
jgi:DNA-binding CsgD family transcriptional regulator